MDLRTASFVTTPPTRFDRIAFPDFVIFTILGGAIILGFVILITMLIRPPQKKIAIRPRLIYIIDTVSV